MQKRNSFFFVFLLFFFLSILTLGISKTKFASFFTEAIFFIPKNVSLFFKGFSAGQDNEIDKLKKENRALLKDIIDQKKLEKENQALKDQFQLAFPKAQRLLPAKIIGAPSFIPGASSPENLIIDKGLKDNVYLGLAVVFKDNLVGKITRVSSSSSLVNVVIHKSFSLAAKTLETGALGITRGTGEEVILDNVLLSENLKTNDIVLTKGEQDINGKGVPADLIIGKIESIEKKPSSLFQKANIKILLDYSKLSTIFIVLPEK